MIILLSEAVRGEGRHEVQERGTAQKEIVDALGLKRLLSRQADT